MVKMKSGREYGFDILRILAILMVMFNHRYTYFCTNSYEGLSLVYVIKVVLAILCKCGPPIFFMISGALLLGKEESFRVVLSHRICKMLLLMMFALGIRMLWFHEYDKPIRIYLSELNWYFYSYVAYLFMLPFLRLIAIHATKRIASLYLVMCALSYTFSGICLGYGWKLSLLEDMPLLSTMWGSSCWNIIFPLTGYYIFRFKNRFYRNEDTSEGNKGFLFGVLASIITLTVGVAIFIHNILDSGVNVSNLENIREHFIFAPSCTIFYAVLLFVDSSRLPEHKTVIKIISFLSSCVLGVFVLETCTGFSAYMEVLVNSWKFGCRPYVSALVSIIFSFFIYVVCVALCKLIPGLRKLL